MTTFPVPHKDLVVTSRCPSLDTAPLHPQPLLHLIVQLHDNVDLDIRINSKAKALRLIDELVANTAAIWPFGDCIEARPSPIHINADAVPAPEGG